MGAVSIPKALVLNAAVLLIAGVAILIPSPAADASPPLCDGKDDGDECTRGEIYESCEVIL